MMKYYTGIVKHDPPKSYGDCLRASVACILNRPSVHDVHHFYHDGCDGKTGMARLRAYCKSIGFIPWTNSFSGEHSLKEVLEFIALQNPDTNYLLFGKTTSGCDHVVICRNDKIIHNVAWSGCDIVSPTSQSYWQIMVFVPLILGEV